MQIAQSYNESGYLQKLVFFASGFGMSMIYLPLMLLSIALNMNGILRHKTKMYSILLYIIFVMFLVTVFGIGSDNFFISSPFNVMWAILILTTYLGAVLEAINDSEKVKLIAFYVLGMCAQCLCIVAYSYMSGGNYGYGLLINPFTGNQINSPSVSNVMALSMSVVLFFLFYKNGVNRIYSSLFILILTAAGVFLSGRTFFFLSGISLGWLLLRNLSFKTVLKSLVYVLLAFIIVTYFLPEGMTKYYDFAIARMSEGLESNRFKHWAHGLTVSPDYPFGGFQVDKSIEDTNWYHNILLDTARVAGFIPLFSFIMFTLTSALLYLYRIKTNLKFFGLMIFTISFLIMQQDVVLEGEYRMLIVFFLSSILLTSNEKTSV